MCTSLYTKFVRVFALCTRRNEVGQKDEVNKPNRKLKWREEDIQ